MSRTKDDVKPKEEAKSRLPVPTWQQQRGFFVTSKEKKNLLDKQAKKEKIGYTTWEAKSRFY